MQNIYIARARESFEIFSLPVQRRGGYWLPSGHRFLLKSSTRDCATGPAIQFRRGPIRRRAIRRRGWVNVGLGRGRGVSRSLSPRIKDASAYTSAFRSIPLVITEFRPPSPPRNPIRKFSHLSLSLSLLHAMRMCVCVCESVYMCACVRGSTTPTAYPIRSLGVSVRWNPDAERPAAAALAAFFARCEIARAPCGVSRVYLACVGGWTLLPIVDGRSHWRARAFACACLKKCIKCVEGGSAIFESYTEQWMLSRMQRREINFLQSKRLV